MKRNGSIVGLIMVMVIAAATPVEAVKSRDEIFLLKSAVLKAGPIRLADVARIKAEKDQKARLGSLIVAKVSAGSEDVLVGNFEICRALAQAQINPATVDIFGASYCRVTVETADRLKQTQGPATKINIIQPTDGLNSEQQVILADELTRRVAQLSGFDVSRLKVDWRCSRRDFLQLPAEANRFKIVPRTAATLGNVCFEVVDNQQIKSKLAAAKSSQAGRRSGVVIVNGYVQLLCESVTALRRLQIGEVITGADIKVVPRRVSNFRDLGITDMNLVIGREAARTIPPRVVIFPEMIRKLQLVKRNQTVKVHSKIGQVRVTLHGEALAGGGLGDEITVRCGKNKTRVLGKVTGLGEVTIGGGPVGEIPPRSGAVDTNVNKILLREK